MIVVLGINISDLALDDDLLVFSKNQCINLIMPHYTLR